jgi:hypothetical protein
MMLQQPLSVIFVAGLLLSNCGTPTQSNGDQSGPPSSPSSSIKPCAAPSLDANRKIVLTAPCDGARVAQRAFVEGTAADANAEVIVIIHPMETSDFWIQPQVTMREGGKWRVLCYFGEPGQQHSGKPYEVMAILSLSKGQYQEGQLLSGWPESNSKSQVVEVVRE